MRVQTTFPGAPGEIEVAEDQVFAMEPALGGFETLRRYVRIPEDDTPLEWLQSIDDPQVVFAMIEPFQVLPGYAFELSDDDAAALGMLSADEAMVRCLVTLREAPEEISVNLLAPIVLSRRSHLGRQLVLQDSGMPLRFPLFESLERQRQVA
ncbi:MAG: flagellar assembly protein FliW [Dehalococcoidia bacterium]|nr:flagellar assembly protein FliW [Dehalococcoidia bacterium]